MNFASSPASRMSSGGYRSPRPGTGIESGNKLGSRPVVRQSKIYRERESGNAMKSLLGHDNLAWDASQQQGVFSGQSVYDAAAQLGMTGHCGGTGGAVAGAGSAGGAGAGAGHRQQRVNFAPGTDMTPMRETSSRPRSRGMATGGRASPSP